MRRMRAGQSSEKLGRSTPDMTSSRIWNGLAFFPFVPMHSWTGIFHVSSSASTTQNE
ncbi:hypothetical protein PF007_g1299 [Phytophthora fragariae]|uniref:Uncharacterized protein n=1 Tax=Phytophthora fragariae TaxID=53985 RepID=A0A6A3TQG4_9STRA|nr:hypothetical protein PF003_g5401 [Phytophthora fragariae]KAE9138676.1 hypothetical protein PF007_g1299 [Phytophthora fragariae]KAE9356583.1 hypothetical protein PF008_g3552 [Phytophthora fragariae]